MEVQFSYNFRGVIPSPAKALRGKKIFVSTLFILLSVILYSLFAYLALMSEGLGFKEIFAIHGLMPTNAVNLSSYPAFILYNYAGPLFALFSLMLGILAVAGIDFEELRGNPFLSAGGAARFSFGRIKQLFMSELIIFIFIAFIIVLGVLVGLIARIPYIGKLLYSAFFFFPNFIVALFAIIIILTQILSILILPTALAASRNAETFRPIAETFLTVTRQPVRWFAYTAYTLIAAKIASFIYAYIAYRAVQFIMFITEIGGGQKINELIASGLRHLPLDSTAVAFITNIFPGIDFGFTISLPTEGGTKSLAGYIMAVMLLLIFLTGWGYILSIIATGQAYIYAVIKFLRDNHSITKEDALFFQPTWTTASMNESDRSKGNNQQV